MKTKKLTRKQAEKILEEKFGNVEFGEYVLPLCHFMPRELYDDWEKYWKEINHYGHGFMWQYIDHNARYISNTEKSFLRLLTAQLFIKDTYK